MTIDLTPYEIQLLEYYEHSVQDVYEGQIYPRQIRVKLMREAGKSIYLSSGCSKCGSRLYEKHGHCFPCNPRNQVFAERHKHSGEVYLAISLSEKLNKIGSTENIAKRKLDRYAEGRDWVIVACFKAKERGKVEHEIHQKLSPFQRKIFYHRGNETILAGEVFSCSLETALKEFYDVMRRHDFEEHYEYQSIQTYIEHSKNWPD